MARGIQLGFIHNQFGDFTAALQSYQDAESLWAELSKRFPDQLNFRINHATALNNLGDVRFETGVAFPQVTEQYDRALAILAETPRDADAGDVLDARETHARILANKARMLLRVSNFEQADQTNRQALEAFQALAKANPTEIKYLVQTAKAANRQMVLLTERDRSGEASQFYDQTLAPLEKQIAQHPQFEEHRREAREVLAANAIDRALALEPLGFDLDALQSYQSGSDNYAALIEQYFNSPNYLINLATGHLNVGLSRHKFGDAAGARDRLVEAVSASDKAYTFWPSVDYLKLQTTAISALGAARADMGVLDEAEKTYQAAIAQVTDSLLPSVPPDDPRARAYRRQRATSRGGLARTLMRLDRTDDARNQIDLAIAEWSELVTLEGEPSLSLVLGLAALHNTRADLLQAATDPAADDDYRKTCELYEQATTKFAKTPESLMTYVEFLLTCPDPQFRKVDRAVELAMSAIKAAPRNGRYKAMLALAHVRNGRWDDAIAAVDEAATLQKPFENPLEQYTRAMALSRKGESDAAKASLQLGKELQAKLGPANILNGRLQAEAQSLVGQ